MSPIYILNSGRNYHQMKQQKWQKLSRNGSNRNGRNSRHMEAMATDKSKAINQSKTLTRGKAN